MVLQGRGPSQLWYQIVVTNVSGVVGGSPKALVRCAGVPRDFGRMAMLDALIWIGVQAGFTLQ